MEKQKMDSHQNANFALIAIVAIVAIIALIVLVKSSQPDENVGKVYFVMDASGSVNPANQNPSTRGNELVDDTTTQITQSQDSKS